MNRALAVQRAVIVHTTLFLLGYWAGRGFVALVTRGPELVERAYGPVRPLRRSSEAAA